MKLFNIYIKKSSNNSIDDLAVVKDNFSYSAFLFNFLWFLQHRMWKESTASILIVIVFIAAYHTGFFMTSNLLIAWFGWMMVVGLNADYWYEKMLIKDGYKFFGNVFAENKDEAKLRFISNCFKDKEHQIFSPLITNLIKTESSSQYFS